MNRIIPTCAPGKVYAVVAIVVSVMMLFMAGLVPALGHLLLGVLFTVFINWLCTLNRAGHYAAWVLAGLSVVGAGIYAFTGGKDKDAAAPATAPATAPASAGTPATSDAATHPSS